MYIVVQRLVSKTRRVGINVFLYMHPNRRWTAPAADIPGADAGQLRQKKIELEPNGHVVRSHLEVIAPDDLETAVSRRHILAVFDRAQSGLMPWKGVDGPCGVALHMVPELVRAGRAGEFGALARAGQQLLETRGTRRRAVESACDPRAPAQAKRLRREQHETAERKESRPLSGRGPHGGEPARSRPSAGVAAMAQPDHAWGSGLGCPEVDSPPRQPARSGRDLWLARAGTHTLSLRLSGSFVAAIPDRLQCARCRTHTPATTTNYTLISAGWCPRRGPGGSPS